MQNGYSANYFLGMVEDHGGLTAARILLGTQGIPRGLKELAKRGCLGISMEALVMQQRWRILFSDEERDIARRRLVSLLSEPLPDFNNPNVTDQSLEDEFHQAMLDVYEQAAKLGYRATRFLQLVRRRGGLEAAQQLLARPGISPGLTRLRELQRLDISMEAAVLKPQFTNLFSDNERLIARQRLESLGWRSMGRRP